MKIKRIITKETREKMSKARTGYKIPQEKRWKLSDETRRKQSDAQRKRPPMSDATRLKLSLSHKGQKGYWEGRTRANVISEKGKKKLSLFMKEQWKNGTLKSHKHSTAEREHMSLKMKGKSTKAWAKMGAEHHNWKGGITEINHKIRSSFEYKLWRKAVFERDNYTCIWCGQRGGRLHVDHIKRFSEYPELRFAIDNGRTLCIPCHKTTDTYGKKKQL
jgi:hypothetical protein